MGRAGWYGVRHGCVLILVLLALAGFLLLGDAFYLEPTWLAERHYRFSEHPRLRLVQLSDLHYRGDRAYLEGIVRRVNELAPDLLVVTGDLVDEERWLDETLTILRQVRVPMYGVRGNHDGWSEPAPEQIAACFRSTGGDWLLDRRVLAAGGKLELCGSTGRELAFAPPSAGTPLRVLLLHFPEYTDQVPPGRFDLILCGHTHGGQVCYPWGGPLISLPMVGKYDRGLFATPAGRLYVHPGIGTFGIAVRLFCRPEIAVFEL